jgi:AcrR family transcriptional regulator
MTTSSPPLESRGSLRAQFRDSARAAILDAAERTFSEHGLDHGRMERIAKRAGVSVGTLYNHFADREALITELIEQRRRELIEHVDAALRSAEEPFDSRLAAFLGAVFAHFEQHRRFLAIVAQGEQPGARLLLTRPHTHPSPILQALVERAEKLMAQGVRHKALAREQPQLLAAMLVGMVRSVLVRELLGPAPRGDSTDLPRRIHRLFLEGARRT